MSRSSASSTKGAGGFVRRAEHQLVDQKLRPSVEQLGERLLSVLGVEGVLLLDRDPGQLLSLLRHLNFDFDFAFTQEQMATGELAKMVAGAPGWLKNWAENVGTDLASGMAESPGWSVFCSPPIVNMTRPCNRMPTCSCGWECSSTTACGSRSTTESIIFSAAQVRIVTTGKIVWREHSSTLGK